MQNPPALADLVQPAWPHLRPPPWACRIVSKSHSKFRFETYNTILTSANSTLGAGWGWTALPTTYNIMGWTIWKYHSFAYHGQCSDRRKRLLWCILNQSINLKVNSRSKVVRTFRFAVLKTSMGPTKPLSTLRMSTKERNLTVPLIWLVLVQPGCLQRLPPPCLTHIPPTSACLRHFELHQLNHWALFCGSTYIIDLTQLWHVQAATFSW